MLGEYVHIRFIALLKGYITIISFPTLVFRIYSSVAKGIFLVSLVSQKENGRSREGNLLKFTAHSIVNI